MTPKTEIDFPALAARIKDWGRELGFQEIGISHGHLAEDEAHLMEWLERGMHGEMEWMQRHGTKRSRPVELRPGTVAIISVRMDYLPSDVAGMEEVLAAPDLAYVSRYALGRDYHKVLRSRLQKLCVRINAEVGEFSYRCFSDSAPVLEKALARDAGLGWIGKHSNLIHPKAGSWFFLGEIYTDLPLPADLGFQTDHCGSCTACIDICPTGAIVGERQVDARRCLSYLSIEHPGAIPIEFRRPMGNRIYGCDDCQIACPWNRFATSSPEGDFSARNSLDRISLLELFAWEEPEFKSRMQGSAIRRIGYQRWQRNIAVALGNAPSSPDIIAALTDRLPSASAMVAEHIRWALEQQAHS
ncbi:MAG: tRNA epoxyqueuosine(34) reductase QueG [Candidatus Eutrophobiaceae bacterium]